MNCVLLAVVSGISLGSEIAYTKTVLLNWLRIVFTNLVNSSECQ